MIRYALVCEASHGFDAWFRDSEAYDVQAAAGQIECPACGSVQVRKSVMAPAIRRGAAPPAEPIAPVPVPPVPAVPGALPAEARPVAMIDEERFSALRAAIRELHARIKAEADDVGPAFPEEARRIHHGEAPERAIFGTATGAEARALVEEGIDLMPIPTLPDDCN